MNKELIGGSIGTALSAVGTAIQTEDILRYISLGITIIGGIITMIIIPLYNWYKNAKADSKITKEEIEEAEKIVSDGINSIKNDVNKKSK